MPKTSKTTQINNLVETFHKICKDDVFIFFSSFLLYSIDQKVKSRKDLNRLRTIYDEWLRSDYIGGLINPELVELWNEMSDV